MALAIDVGLRTSTNCNKNQQVAPGFHGAAETARWPPDTHMVQVCHIPSGQ